MHKRIPAQHAPLIVILNQDFEQGYQSGKAFVEEGQEVKVMDSERLIANLKSLSLDGLFNGTQDDLLNWHIGFLVGKINGSVNV